MSFFKSCFFLSFVLTTTSTVTRYNILLTWRRGRTKVKKTPCSPLQTVLVGLHNPKTKESKDRKMAGGRGGEVFTSSWAGRRRRWGPGRRNWCPWTWRSSGEPRGSCCCCRPCRRCWAWRPWLLRSSASGPWSPGPFAGSALWDHRGAKKTKSAMVNESQRKTFWPQNCIDFRLLKWAEEPHETLG